MGRLDAAHHLLPLLATEDSDSQHEIELHKAIIKAEGPKGGKADEAISKMRMRLKELKGKQDRELLSDRNATSLKNAGDSAIRTVMTGKGRIFQQILLSVWAFTWEGWRQGKTIDKRGIIRAAGKPAKVIVGVALSLIAVIAICVVTILVMVTIHAY